MTGFTVAACTLPWGHRVGLVPFVGHPLYEQPKSGLHLKVAPSLIISYLSFILVYLLQVPLARKMIYANEKVN